MDLGHTIRELYSRERREGEPDRIDLDGAALFDLLADSRRRFVIERLANGGGTTCAELAVDIAAAETHTTEEYVPPRRVEPVEGDLRDEQLPRLAEAGLVRWDAQDDRIRPGHSVEAIARLLREVDRRTRHARSADESPFAVGASPVDWETQQSQPESGRHHP